MKTLEKIQDWGDHHHPKWLDIFRIALGLVLIWKSIEFILNLNALADFLRETGLTDQIGTSVFFNAINLSHYCPSFYRWHLYRFRHTHPSVLPFEFASAVGRCIPG